MKLLKKMPPSKPGQTLTVHLSRHEMEWVQFKSGPKLCHKVLGYSVKKSKPFNPVEFLTEAELIKRIKKEIKNVEKK